MKGDWLAINVVAAVATRTQGKVSFPVGQLADQAQ